MKAEKENNLTELKKLSNLRINLECFAAREAAARAKEDGQVTVILKGLLSELSNISAKEDYNAFDTADHNLHEKIVELANVPNLREIWNIVWRSLAAFHRVSLRNYWADLQMLVEEHNYLVEAICGGDIHAADDAIKNHLEAVWYRITDNHGGFAENNDHLQRAAAYISFHLNRELQLQTVAKEVAFVSPGHLSRLFKERYGLSFQAYLQKVRLEKASELIKDTQLTISRIARRVGYRDAARFSQHFKRHYRLSPTQYRKNAE